jgi:RNA ligase (TIGR02306 family)
MRKLASIQKIEWVKPIEKRDFIELVGVLGWQAIVKKGEFQVGDKIIFVEVDSILPEKPEFEFLRSKKFRIKTLKLSGTLSQGICFPISILPQNNYYTIDEDVTDILQIKKYEAHSNVDSEEDTENKSKTFKHPAMKWMMKFKLCIKLLNTTHRYF